MRSLEVPAGRPPPAAPPVPPTVVIPAGEFWMGATADDKFASLLERPRHRVTFRSPFALGVA